MENSNDQETKEIPQTLISKYSYIDFKKICESYSNILTLILNENNNNKLFSKDDIFVLNDLIHEIINYSKYLLKNNFISESKNIIKIGIKIADSIYDVYNKLNLGENFLKFPLKLKLCLLESDFNLHFKYLKDYIYSQIILLDIIEIQKRMQLSDVYLGSSYFYLGLIYFYNSKYGESEKIMNISKQYFTPIELEINEENRIIINKILIRKNFNSDIKIWKKKNDLKIKKFTNALRVLLEIYLLKKEYLNAINLSENTYLFFLENYGFYHFYTNYFKNKFIIIYNKIKDYMPLGYNLVVNGENCETESRSINDNEDKIIKFHNYNNKNKDIIYGRSHFFKFKIEKTELYLPMIISLYNLHVKNEEDIYTSKNLIKKLYFNKNKLLKFFGVENASNSFFYLDRNIIKLLKGIEYKNNKISFINNKLKMCLMINK